MWYIIPHGSPLTFDPLDGFDNFGDARERADALHRSSGNHYHVVKVQTAHTTDRSIPPQMLSDIFTPYEEPAR